MEWLFDLAGLKIPFALATATYGIFYWLDSNASDEVTQIISSWLNGRSKNKPDLGNLIISAFDRIYTSPLLSFRAVRRSAAISSIVWLLVYFVPHWEIMVSTEIRFIRELIFEWGVFLAIIVIVDYVSLLFVRRFLVLARIYPFMASIISSIVGLFVVMLGLIILLALTSLLVPFGLSIFELLDPTSIPKLFFGIMRPALIIHLWLPLFALSSLVVKLAYPILGAVEWAQWFLKQGDAHPLKAIGIVATIIVFGSAMLVKEGWALLSVLERS